MKGGEGRIYEHDVPRYRTRIEGEFALERESPEVIKLGKHSIAVELQ